MTKLRRNSLVLMTLVILFAAPGLIAYVFYNHPTWLGGVPTNRGVLLNPPSIVTSMDQSKKWRLVFWSPTACDTLCMRRMDELARVRLALGRRLYHVDTYLVLDATAPALSAAELKILHDTECHVLILSARNRPDHVILGEQPAVYLVNPDNYLILKYALASPPDDIFHDIKQLVQDK